MQVQNLFYFLSLRDVEFPGAHFKPEGMKVLEQWFNLLNIRLSWGAFKKKILLPRLYPRTIKSDPSEVLPSVLFNAPREFQQ